MSLQHLCRRSFWQNLNLLALAMLTCFAAPVFSSNLHATWREAKQLLDALEQGQFESVDRAYAKLEAMQPGLTHAPTALQMRHQLQMCWLFPTKNSEGLALADRGLQRAKQLQQSQAVIEFQLCRGHFHHLLNDYKAARRDFNAGLNAAEQITAPLLVAKALSLRADLNGEVGELAFSLTDYIRAQRIYDEQGSTYLAESNLRRLANAYRRLGDPHKALSIYQELQRSASLAQRPSDLIELLHLLGLVHNDLQMGPVALDYFERAVALAEQNGDRTHLALGYLYLGGSLAALGEPSAALENLQRFESLSEHISGVEAAMLHMHRAQALFRLARLDAALAEIESAEAFFISNRSTRFLAHALELHALILAQQGQWQAAYEKQQEYLEVEELLDAQIQQQQNLRLRTEFEVERKEAENERLRYEQELQQQRLNAAQKARNWQQLVIVLASLILLFTFGAILRQRGQTQRYSRMAMTDELTGIANRRAIMLQAQDQLTIAHQRQLPLSVAIFDVDLFKQINDGFGHDIGDQVLREITSVSRLSLRQRDMLGRTGGEEFLVVLPETNRAQALVISNRLRRAIQRHDYSDIAADLNVSVSIGVAEWGPEDTELNDLLKRADGWLYRAKQQGRNQVVAFE